MSAISKAMLGEDEERRQLLRLAMAGIPQARKKMLQIKRAFDEMGGRNITVEHYPSRAHTWAVVLINGEFGGMISWDTAIHPFQAKNELKALFNKAIKKAGCLDDVLGKIMFSTGGIGFRIGFRMKKHGDFNGVLKADGTFQSDNRLPMINLPDDE